MGAAVSDGADATAATLAAGLPEELDWHALISQIFLPAHEAVLLLTSEETCAGNTGCGQPCKVVDCYRSNGSGTGPGAFEPDDFDGRVGLVSQKGKKAAPNQDSAFYLEFVDGDGARVWMACVMDGHGPLGHEISRLVMQWLPVLVLRDPGMASEHGLVVPNDPQVVLNALISACAKTGSVMTRASSGLMERKMSGSTCVFVLCARGILHSANVGDSRAVFGSIQSSEGSSAFALKVETRGLTRDHKPEDVEERPRIENMGGIIQSQRVYTRVRPFIGLNLSRSFGDTYAHAVGVSHVPDVNSTFLDEKERQFVVLASDGVWEFVSNEEAVESVAAQLLDAGAQTAALRLVTRATECWRRHTHELDDVTSIVVNI